MLKLISLESNHRNFVPLHFRDDYNVVLADRDSASSEKDSRNGLGKTTLINIIHFCLCSRSAGEGIEKNPIFKEWEFTLEIEAGNGRYRITRSVAVPQIIKVLVVQGSHPKEAGHPEDNSYSLSVQDCSRFLGTIVFGLPYDDNPNAPSFRSLISYFIRRGSGYEDAFKSIAMQSVADSVLCNSFLLHLNWEEIAQIYTLEVKRKALTQMKKLAESGALEGVTASKGDLEAERVRLEEQCSSLSTQISGYKVLEEYRSIESEANEITNTIHDLVNRRVLSRQIIEQYRATISEEKDISADSLEALYNEAGLLFPDTVRHSLTEVTDFHRNVVRNRQEYLGDEVQKHEREISEINKEVTNLTNSRTRLLSILDSKGVLLEYSELRSRLSALESLLNDVVNKIDSLENIDEKLSSLKIQKEEAIILVRRDLSERKSVIDRAISIFNENSQRLYSEPGNLVVDITDKGLSLSIEIKSSDSNGVNRMKIFCYDLTLAQLWVELSKKPLIVAHDSTVFEGVDERQVAHALELAFEKANKFGFQYLCNMNSDNVPQKEMSNFYPTFSETVIRTLKDSDPSLTLLGIKF